VPRLYQNRFDFSDLAQRIVKESVHNLLKDRAALEVMEFLDSSAMLQKQARYLGMEITAG
jgi:hypothetical protein